MINFRRSQHYYQIIFILYQKETTTLYMFKEETGDQFFNNVKLFFKKLYSRNNGIFKAKWNPQLPSYCETPKTVNPRNSYGMLLCCEKLASKAQDN